MKMKVCCAPLSPFSLSFGGAISSTEDSAWLSSANDHPAVFTLAVVSLSEGFI